MKLIAKDKNDKKRSPSEVIGITNDGWVVTRDGAFGDLGEDCEIELDMTGYLKEFRKKHGLSQQNVAWLLGIARASYVGYEKGRQGLSLKQFLMLAAYMPDTEFAKLKRKFVTPHSSLGK